MEHISKITLYVDDQQSAKQFWVDKVGFSVVFEQQMGDILWMEVAPKQENQTTLVLYDKKLMQAQNPTTNVGHPSMILTTKDIQEDYQRMQQNGVKVGELMIFPYGKMFSFQDQDGNDYMLRED